jgi:hypothetical protein
MSIDNILGIIKRKKPEEIISTRRKEAISNLRKDYLMNHSGPNAEEEFKNRFDEDCFIDGHDPYIEWILSKYKSPEGLSIKDTEKINEYSDLFEKAYGIMPYDYSPTKLLGIGNKETVFLVSMPSSMIEYARNAQIIRDEEKRNNEIQKAEERKRLYDSSGILGKAIMRIADYFSKP